MSENHTQVNSYQEKILEAMQIVSSQLISSIPYDKTIVCTIIDDSEKDKGKYKVVNGETSFDAYSSDTKLKKDDIVYVTIPEGNYDNQKIIQGKKTSDTDKPFVFTTPLDTMLDITGNLMEGPNVDKDRYKVKKENSEEFNEGKLIANNHYRTKTNEDGEEIVDNYNAQLIKLYERTGMSEAGYTRLGIKAGFMSWLPEATSGSYGLKITIKDNLVTTTTDEQKVDSKQSTKTILLDVSEMYGNPYNFETYYEQEKVIPINELNTITDIIVEFYQIGGSFYDIENNILPLQEEEITTDETGIKTHSTTFGHNLFVDVDSIEIGLGYDIAEITDELIVPVIKDSMTYSAYREEELNKKYIDLRWVHQFADDGPLVVEKTRDLIGDSPRLKDCEIRWYRYQLGTPAADEYSGVYWTGLTVTKNEDKYILSPWDGKTKEIEVKDALGVLEIDPDTGQPKSRTVPDFGEPHALEQVVFRPDTSYQVEQIKAIIFLNGTAIRGPIITFNNEQSTAGTEVTNFINALDIDCIDGTLGNYLIYNEAGNILNYSDSQIERKLQCTFAETGSIARSTLLLDFDKGDTIAWKIPIKATMISLQRCGKSNQVSYNPVTVTNENFVANTYYIYNEETEEYETTVEFKENTNYFERKITSEKIELDKVWTLQQEYKGDPSKASFEFVECYKKNSEGEFVFNDEGEKILSHYECREDGQVYYIHPSLNYFEDYYEPWNIYKDFSERYIILQNERTLDYNDITNITSILYPTYKIGSLCSMQNMNNTIACTIRKDRVIYTAEREFTFGVAGTMGTDNSIVVDFVGGQNAVLVGDTGSYQLEVKMYDENNKPKDLSGVPVLWEWYAPGGDTISPNKLKFGANANTSVVELINNLTASSLNTSTEIYIAKVSVGEEGAEVVTYFPIPLKLSEEYSHIDGATSVIYLSNNEPNFYKGDYQLYITNDDSFGSPDIQVLPQTEVTWAIISQESSTSPYIANIESDGKGGLKPISVYTSGVRNYAVTATHNGQVVWQQPILVLRNNYPSRVINKWDGKTLTIDEEMGTILSTSIAAGMKENDNTFTGVMLGDWSDSSTDASLSKNTGIYGFHRGAMSYAFKDDGTGFIGKNAVGRIEFNGNEATITSSNYKEPTSTSNGAGMKIDFNGKSHQDANGNSIAPFIKMYGTGGKIILDTKATATGYPFEIGDKFKARWDGHIIANSGLIGGWELEEVKRDTDNTSISGGRLIATNVTASQSSYWDKIYLDPLTNTISGGKLKASIFESTSTKPIKLGGAIDVYDPSKLVAITNPHTGNSENQVNYNTTSGGTNQAILGGTLGFMPMSGGADVPADFQPAGIGFKAAGTGAEVKATNQNVGMNIGRNYLFLSNYTNSSGKAVSEFQVVVHGQSTQVEYTKTGTDADGNDVYKTEEKQVTASSSMVFNGSGLAVKSGGGNGGRVILEEGSHAGIGYGDSYVALYRSEAQLVGATQVKIGTKYGQDLLVGKTSTLDIGTAISKITIGRETVGTGDSAVNGTTTLLKGGRIDLNAATINLTGTTKITGATTITGYLTGQAGAKISGATASLEGASGVKGLIVKNGYELNGAGTINGNLTRTSGNLTWQGGTIDFTNATQKGIKAQFA